MSEELSIRDLRLQKLARMRELGHDPYAVERFDRTDSAKNLLEKFEESKPVSFAGRVVSYRLMGKAGFAHISDGDAKIQGYFRKDDLKDAGWELYNLLDIGDHVGVRGFLFTTRTGEPSIHVQELVPLSKALHAIPIGKEKDGKVFYGLSDVDLRYRHRHLDLIANATARQRLLRRARIVTAVRQYFDAHGYVEVETPLLQLEAGGAAARPFTTHYNAYDIDVKLRISLELYLKRLICGDIPAVYEIGRVFRNEGLSNRHNPEFTLLEFYEAYGNLDTMMNRVEELFCEVTKKACGSTIVDVLGSADELANNNVRRAFSPERTLSLASEGDLSIDLAPAPDRDEAIELAIHGGQVYPMTDIELEITGLHSVARPILQVDEGEIDISHDVDGRLLLFVRPHTVVSIGGESKPIPPGWWIIVGVGFRSVRPSRIIDFSKPWKRVNLLDAIQGYTGLTAEDLSDFDRAIARSKELDVPAKARAAGGEINLAKEHNLGGFIEKLLEVFVEPTLQEPTFVVGYPIETSPLAKKDPNNPRMTRRFEGYVLGREVCNAFSEINDPIDQRERFEQQLGERAKGDDEAHPMDEDFVYALESGMPPTGGCGIGLDRMAMLLTGSDHIREVLFFPFMRPEAV